MGGQRPPILLQPIVHDPCVQGTDKIAVGRGTWIQRPCSRWSSRWKPPFKIRKWGFQTWRFWAEIVGHSRGVFLVGMYVNFRGKKTFSVISTLEVILGRNPKCNSRKVPGFYTFPGRKAARSGGKTVCNVRKTAENARGKPHLFKTSKIIKKYWISRKLEQF